MKEFVLTLEKLYKDTTFIINDDGYIVEVIYNKKELKNNNDFFKTICELTATYLSDKEDLRLVVVSNYIDDI